MSFGRRRKTIFFERGSGRVRDGFTDTDAADRRPESAAAPGQRVSSEPLAQRLQTAASMGRLLEMPKVVQTMERVLQEGKRFDEEMTKLAEGEVSPAMLADEEEEEEGDEEEGGHSRKRARSGSKSRSKRAKSH
jgi:hypothetical protein